MAKPTLSISCLSEGGSSLSKGIYEETDTNYSSEEKKLFDVNREIENLIVELESKDNEIKTQQKA